jgi:predicted transcriptional regulator
MAAMKTKALTDAIPKDEFGTELRTDFACIDAALNQTPKPMVAIVSEARAIARTRGIVMRYDTYYDHINKRLIANGFVEKLGPKRSQTYALTAKGLALRASHSFLSAEAALRSFENATRRVLPANTPAGIVE